MHRTAQTSWEPHKKSKARYGNRLRGIEQHGIDSNNGAAAMGDGLNAGSIAASNYDSNTGGGKEGGGGGRSLLNNGYGRADVSGAQQARPGDSNGREGAEGLHPLRVPNIGA